MSRTPTPTDIDQDRAARLGVVMDYVEIDAVGQQMIAAAAGLRRRFA